MIGMPRLLAERGVALSDDDQARLASLQAQGKTAMLIALDERVAGVIAVADRVRPSAGQTITQLQALGI